jgi:hypothetical protein
MKKRMLLALLLVAFMAMPAFAAVQNVKVGAYIDNTYLYRENFNFGATGGADEQQSLFITQTQVRIDADLTEKVAATIALLNERVWNNDPGSTASGVDLNLAYLVLKEIFGSNATVMIGRMGEGWNYGNSFIFDATGTNNSAPGDSGLTSIAGDITRQTALDGVRTIFDFNPLTVDLVFAVIESDTTTLSADNDRANYLYGTNVNYQLNDERNTEVEGYFWYRVDKNENAVGTENEKADVLKIIGGRFSTNLMEGLNVQGELAFQGGNDVVDGDNNRSRKAYGLQAIVNYQLPIMQEYNPVAQYVYTKVTGDGDPSTDTNEESTAWDPFFEAQAGGKIYNALFNLSNAHIHVFSLSANPIEDLTATLSTTLLWLEAPLHGSSVGDDITDLSLVQPDGTAALVDAEVGETWLGKEIDFDLVYDYTEDVQFGLSYGWFFPGTVFALANSDAPKQLLLNVDVAF